ncbi:hypothetical protein PoB_002897200 [Plakobranchus ocellatus]|uniref:Uncharacterized protein n=1 Tax=Plakobranchus ocellatus TaxID=259542 RepID=A0AAV4A5E3_9GAST|nr:hypothetical protein PoB_002897200 [Plakobranchus ocellatus]
MPNDVEFKVETRLWEGKINGTSKSTLDLPRDVDLPLDGSPSGHRSASGRRVCLWTQGLPPDVGLPLGVGSGLYPAVQDSTTTGRLLWLAYGRYPGLVVRQLAHVSTVSSPVRHTVTTWSLSHQAPVLVCVPSMSRQGHAQGKGKFDCIKFSVLYCIT